MDVLKDIGGIAFRSVIMFFLTLLAVRVSGKRSLAQLAPHDLAVIIIIGSVAALPLEEESISMLHGAIPIVVLSFLEYLLSLVSIHWRGFEKVTQGQSRPLVMDGQILYDNLKKERVSVADLHVVLRQAGADHIPDIALATLEPTGQCSVIKKQSAQPVTAKDMHRLAMVRFESVLGDMKQRNKSRFLERYDSLPERSPGRM